MLFGWSLVIVRAAVDKRTCLSRPWPAAAAVSQNKPERALARARSNAGACEGVPVVSRGEVVQHPCNKQLGEAVNGGRWRSTEMAPTQGKRK